jgi:integrase
VGDVFNRAAKRAKLAKLTPHDFRRAFATHLIANLAHPAAVTEMLGHRGGYRHLAPYVHPHFLGSLGGRTLR